MDATVSAMNTLNHAQSCSALKTIAAACAISGDFR